MTTMPPARLGADGVVLAPSRRGVATPHPVDSLVPGRLDLDEPAGTAEETASPVHVPTVGVIPDLLHAEPQLAVDAAGLGAALDYAFAGGGCIETLYRALDEAPLERSSWQPERYGADLFLDEFVEGCMSIEHDGTRRSLDRAFLVRVLSHPPRRPETVAFRRAQLAELSAEPELRRSFEDLYRRLCHLRECFGHVACTTRYEATRHRVETLRAIRDVVDLMAGPFVDARSGLGRIGELGQQIQSTEGYRRLVELVALDGDLASVDVRVQLGADGRVRRFALIGVRENERNAFHVSPLRRVLRRLSLWWRGYRFNEDELVERWLDAVFDGVSAALPSCFQLLGHMEVYLAALAFRGRCEARGLAVCFPELCDDGAPWVEGMFNPLLFDQGIEPSPCDLQGTSFPTTTIVTGPNSGGKTRLLQAFGLLQVLAQAGLYAPAKAARIRRVPGLFASLRAEHRADQAEGHLGTELIRIRQLFETTARGSLVLLDELCSGTNPSEAAELFTMVLRLLGELGAHAIITTHYLDLMHQLAAQPVDRGLSFLQAEIDPVGRPTFGFVPGVAPSSLAAETAARLGVTEEQLAALVRRSGSASRQTAK